MKRAICLISGGMDSFVSAAIAAKNRYHIYGLTVNYGQKNTNELRAADRIASFLHVEKHIRVNMDLAGLKSALTDKKIPVPSRAPLGEIPATYVPARNTILISIALAFAETLDAEAIFTGINAVDFSGYPDCRPEYLRRFQSLIETATQKTAGGGTIKIKTPLLKMSKTAIIKQGQALKLDFSLTWTCYRNGRKPCRTCPSCRLRAEGFREAGIRDPLLNGK